MNEEWRNIEGYEGLYQVSNFGRVKSLNYNNTNQEKILSQFGNGKGYLFVNLYKERKMKNCYVHRLVAQAFLDNTNNYPMINHKDENKENNCVDNLEWCTQQYNVNYGTAQARRIANTDYKAKTAKMDYKAIAEKQSKQVYQYDKQCNLIKIWKSTMECDRNGFNSSAISTCCNGKRNSHKGFVWSYTPIEPIS